MQEAVLPEGSREEYRVVKGKERKRKENVV